MKILLFLIILFTAVTSFADHTPIGYRQWKNDNGSTETRIGGMVHNYPVNDSTWAIINNNFTTEGDSVLKIDDANLKVRVNKNGTVKVRYREGGNTYTVTQQLKGIYFLNIDTKQRFAIDASMDFSNVSKTDSIVKWLGVSQGVDYRVIKGNGTVAHEIRFKAGFLDSAVTLFDQRADSQFIALANVIEYSFSSNIKNYDSAIGDVRRRELKRLTNHIFELSQQEVFWSNDTTYKRETVPVRQFWTKQNGKHFMVEYMMMSTVKKIHEANPNSFVGHNTETTISTPDVEDVGIREDAPDANHGGATTFNVWNTTPGTNLWKLLIRATGLNSGLPSGEGINNCSLVVNALTKFTNGTYNVAQVLKFNWEEGTAAGGNLTPGVEVGATGDFWANSNSDDWATLRACQCEKDDGAENIIDNGACTNARADRVATPDGSLSITATGRKAIDITSFAQANASSAMPDSLNMIFYNDGVGDFFFGCTENGTAGNRPFFVFITSAAATGRNRIFNTGMIGFITDEPEDDEWLSIEAREEIKNMKRELTQ